MRIGLLGGIRDVDLRQSNPQNLGAIEFIFLFYLLIVLVALLLRALPDALRLIVT